jgi:hypothetical protein
VSTLTREITFLDLSTGQTRTGQYWSDAPLVTGRHAVWVVSDGKPVHVHKVAARNRDTRRALTGHTDVPEYVTGVRTVYGNVRHDLTRA